MFVCIWSGWVIGISALTVHRVDRSLYTASRLSALGPVDSKDTLLLSEPEGIYSCSIRVLHGLPISARH